MASCFKNPNKTNLSAKDYTIKKRRTTLFCDLRQKALLNAKKGLVINTGNNEGCVDKDGIFIKFKDHKAQLDMIRAFEDFRVDLLKAVQGQLFKNHFCPPYYVEEKDNTNIRNGYYNDNVQLAFGEGTSHLDQASTIEGTYGHLTNYFGALNQDIISVHPYGKNEYRNTYAEIKPINSSLGGDLLGGFTNNKFFLLKPPVCDNDTRAQVFRTNDFTAPELVGMTILIEDQNGLPAPQVVAMGPVIE